MSGSSVKILMKLYSPSPVGNAAAALAMNPELLVFAGCGSFLTDTMRNRYNYLFHRRGLRTVVTDPLMLERGAETLCGEQLSALLGRYADVRPCVDISGGDAMLGMALGAVLSEHPGWECPVFESRLSEGVFVPGKHADFVRRIAFPSMTAAEMSYLRTGSPVMPDEENDVCLRRKDLDRTLVRLIRGASGLYAERRSDWEKISLAFRDSIVGSSPGRLDYVEDTRRLGVRDDALDELADAGFLASYERRGGTLRLRFESEAASELLLHFERVPLWQSFLTAAYVRKYDGSAAYRDLVLRRTYAAGIRDCVPRIIACLCGGETADDLVLLKHRAAAEYGDLLKIFLVRTSAADITDQVRLTASELDMKIVSQEGLSEALQPR